MSLRSILKELGIEAAAEALAPFWDEARRARPHGVLPFFEDAFIRDACAYANDLPVDLTDAVLASARRIAKNDAACALAWYCHHRLFAASPEESPWLRDLPLASEALGSDAGMFNVIVLLSGTPRLKELHRRRNIPPDIARHGLYDLEICLRHQDYTREHGPWGISPGILNWMMLHYRAELFRLGRLQYIPRPFHGKLRAWRHRRSRAVVALSEPGVVYRADGQIDGAGDVRDPDGAWTSTLENTGDGAVGYPIHPSGRAIREKVCLRAGEWTLILEPGTPILNMHIPMGEPMDFDRCGDSMRQAMAFFPKHFPEKPFVGFDCLSWILDHQFEELLPATSNLVRFQQEVYLFPLPGTGGSFWWRVFGREYPNRENLPRETTMQRAFADHLERGGHFRNGGCFLMVDDFDWGAQVYRRSAERAEWPQERKRVG